MKLVELVQPDSIIADLESQERNAVIRDLVQKLADGNHLPVDSADGIVRSIIARERTRGTTGFGKGVAMPHAKIENQPRVVAAVGRSVQGINFESLDGQPVYSVFLIVSPADAAEEHVRAMDLIYRHLQQEQFRKFLRQSDTPEKIYDLLKEADEQSLAL